MMAGNWIKMRHDLATDPAVIAIAARLGLDEDTIVGKLHRLWSWADQHTSDGNAVGVTLLWLDRYVGVTGFCEMLCRVGWMEHRDDGVRIVNFDRHMGKSAKMRALTAERVKRSRNAGSVTKALPEKIREEKNKKSHKQRACGLASDFAPNDTHRRLAQENGVSLDDQLVRFREHAEANGRLLVNWDAGFCTWLRNAPRFNGGPNGNRPTRRPSPVGSQTPGAGTTDTLEADREAMRRQRAEYAAKRDADAKLAAASGS